MKHAGAQAGILAAIIIGGLAATVSPPAAAEPSPALTQAIIGARGPTPCGDLRYHPLAEQAADIVNRSTKSYLDHTGDNIPADDPRPIAITNDLGIAGDKVYALQGAGYTDADAIKAVLIQGYNIIPDCDYGDFGASMLREDNTGFSLAVVVLVGH